jgi:hypothetical protein
MKNKFWKISSMIMAPLSLMMTIITAANHNWALMTMWGVTTVIWIFNIKLYWND